jgi:protoporphyrinogen oxidase
MLSLLGDNKIKNKRNSKIFYGGTYVKYPFENGLADLSRQDNFECLHGFVLSLIKKAQEPARTPKNFKEWCHHAFGAGIAEKYLIPYNEKIWKFQTDKISTDWVQRLPNPSLEDIIRSSLGCNTEGYKHQLFFYYPKFGGIQTLIKTLENGLERNIVRDYCITRIRKEGDKWIISNDGQARSYDRIISTIPLPDLVKALQINGAVKKAADNLKCNSLITVFLGLRVAKLNNFSWVYIPNKSLVAHRISFPSNYSPDAAPKGRSSVLAEITCNFEDQVWRMKDVDIAGRVCEELHQAKILSKRDICYWSVKRSKYAYVVYDLDHRKNVRLIHKHLKNIGVDVVGRFSEFEYLNMDGCIKHAHAFVDKLHNHE